MNDKKITKIKYNKGRRWPPFDILHATTNQRHAGVMKGEGTECTTVQGC